MYPFQANCCHVQLITIFYPKKRAPSHNISSLILIEIKNYNDIIKFKINIYKYHSNNIASISLLRLLRANKQPTALEPIAMARNNHNSDDSGNQE